ncbi:MAG: hypothetical protein GX495_13835 [Chloroflexi bacterium]|jgi:hypothetical protein|nr:hypothetical protein [Chloroflexota bacterium]
MKALKGEAVPTYTDTAVQPAISPAARLRSLAAGVGNAGKWVLISLLFGISYTQSVLYDGNQNTKFLHGLAQAGVGFLHEDWLANTADPLPAFTFLVRITLEYLNENFFYGYYLIIMGVYICSLLGIASILFDLKSSPAKFATLAAGLIVIHARWPINIALNHLSFNLEILHFGVAEQYILGQEFQNSVFGVFLLLSMLLFLNRRYFWAFFCLGFTSIMHSAYLFSAALLTVTYAAIIFLESLKPSAQTWRAIRWGQILQAARLPLMYSLLTLLMVLPVLWYNFTALASTSPEAAAQSMAILVHERIPHHSLPASWFDWGVYIQLGMILAGLVLARKSRLFWLMLVPFLGGLILTFVQIITASDSLGMLAPWRVSVFLVPLGTVLVLGYVVSLVFDLLRGRARIVQPVIVLLSLAAVAFVTYQGVSIQQERFDIHKRRAVVRVFNYARNHQAPGQVYLVPPHDNKFDDFRLYSGVPIFINWKSHPYRDFEVLEWYKRVQEAQAFYDAEPDEACQILSGLQQKYGITHVVFKFDRTPPPCEQMVEVMDKARYKIFEVRP